jgi:hypothetical protein
MAFEIAGAVLVESALEAGVAEFALAEAMPLAFEAFAPEALGFAGEAFAGFGGETLASLFGSEAVPAVLQQAATPMAESALTGGMGAGEGITAATHGAIETGAALPEVAEAASTFGSPPVPEGIVGNVPTPGMGAVPAEPLPVPEPAGIQTASGPATSDVAGYQGDQSVLDMVKNATPDQMIPNNPLPPGFEPSAPSSILPSPGPTPTPTAPPEIMGSIEEPLTSGLELPPPEPPNPFLEGLKSVGTWMGDNPGKTALGAYALASTTGMLNQKPQTFGQQSSSTFNSPYHFSSNFQGSHPNPQQYQYQPSYSGYAGYKGYAGGGIMQAAPAIGTPAANTTMDSTMGNNTMFPMSEMDRSYYATPTQLPSGISHNQNPQTPQSVAGTTGGYETKVDPYAGTMSMAEGGIARYYRGELATSTGGRGDVYGATQRFLEMYDPQSKYQPLEGNKDVGIFHDTNPSTRDKSAYQASGIRNKAIANKANVKTGANYTPPSRQMGQLNLNTPNSKEDKDSDSDQVLTGASGGIMGASSLGGYAAGGNPRLLKGPGDGMSDNIPATIGGRQPARLADGEFVVPADVVSHLGNGSTDAGAKRLHEMMNKVRVDRTGKKKQAPAVKADKYIPK